MPSARGEKVYWAADETAKAVAEIDERVEQYYQVIRSSRIMDLWRSAHWACYAGQRTGGNLGIAGEAGELTTIELNDYANLKQHIINYVTAQRPYFEAKAINNDHLSQTQTILAQSLVETVMRERDLEGAAHRTVDFAVQYGDGWLGVEWDAQEGEDFRPDPETGQVVKTGDVIFGTYGAWDVVRDTLKDSNDQLDWYVVRRWRNRFDLIARYPELGDEIAQVPTKYETEDRRPRIVSRQWTQTTGIQVNDDVPTWTFYHERTPAMPDGRMLVYLTPDLVLYDGPLPYRKIPLYRMAAMDVHGTIHGYTMMHDLLAPQYAVNAVASTIVSNQAALGVQNVWVPSGANVTWKEIKGGLNLLEGGIQPPQPLQLLATSPETFTLLELLQKQMETLSGVNAVARGNPQESLKSGAALALVQAQAIQFLSLTQKAYVRLLEAVCTEVVHQYQDFASLPHLITVTGQGNREYAQSFKGEDIAHISRVTVQQQNPLMATLSGRYNLGEMMVQSGLVKDPLQLNMVLSTGRLEPLVQGPQKERLNIASENERLANGQPCVAVITDNHPLHIMENSSVLDSPEARENPDVVRAVTEHLLEHQQLWETAPPSLLAAKGVPPPPMPAMMGMGGGAGGEGAPGGAASGPSSGSEGKPGMPPAPVPGDPETQGMDAANLPNMPKNPLTGDRQEAPPGLPA